MNSHSFFEKQDSLNDPIECFVFDAASEEFPVKPHWHYFAEFIYMVRGSAEIASDGKTYILNEGEFLMVHPSALHSIVSVTDELPLYEVIKLDLSQFPSKSAYAPTPTDIFKYARGKNMKVMFDTEAASKLHCREIIEDCIREVNEYRYGCDVVIRAQIYRLIYGIVRSWISSGLNIDDCPISPADSFGIENITEYIDLHLHENIKVRDVAEACHISYSGFAAKFHEFYGMSCKDYIERMRIFKAEEYLTFTDHDLNYISEKTGFADSSHLIRSFKKYRGITPKQFRLKRRKKA
ncbi:MAG: helix-turn-helix transcriptional regulator [Clostridiales bacterium]|nr:helix-turn-helix transcriptional regulator [Clostridiales bacterium]